MRAAVTTTARRRLALLLGLSVAGGARSSDLGAQPARAASALGPCRHDAEGDLALGHFKQRLVQFGGYAADSLHIVTDSATCARGVAAYNRLHAPEHQVRDAYILRRGCDGFVLISPQRLNDAVYFTRTWELIATEVGI